MISHTNQVLTRIIRRWRIALLFISGVSFSVNAGTNTAAIVTAAALGALDCVDFCWIGICISVYCTTFGCSIDYSPWIEHRSPDYVASAYKEPGENTWDEMRAILEGPAKAAASAQTALWSGLEATGGPNYILRQRRNKEMKTGQERAFGNLHFKEGTIIGSPTSLATNLIPYTCPSNTIPYFPYYQSEFDAFEWRWGIAEKIYPSSWIPGLREISQVPLTTWGGVKPRMGFIKSEHPARAAAVASQRMIDIATRLWQPHVYYPTFGKESDEKTDQWQMLYPEMDESCYSFGHPLDYVFERVDDLEQYAFLYWGLLDCCPIAKGVVIAQIPAARVCL